MREESVCIRSGPLRSVPEGKTGPQKFPQSLLHACGGGRVRRSAPMNRSTNKKKIKNKAAATSYEKT